jgi:folate-binding protein YgfZ
MVREAVEKAIRSSALFVKAPELGTIAVTGTDRQSWLNGLLTSDLSRLAPGRSSYGLVLVKVGRILSDAWLVHAGDRLLVGMPRERVALVREHLERYLVMEDAAHADVSDEHAWAFAFGPRAAELVTEGAAAHGGFGGALDVTGLGDGVMVLPRARMDEALADLAARAPESIVGSDDDREMVRVARFIPRFGVDFGDKTYPQEAALEKIAVSFQKGCYLGQEVVCRLEMRGHVIKKIVPLSVDGQSPPALGTEVRSSEGKVLGSVTSAIAGDDHALALAMIRVDFTEPGVKVDVAGRVGTVLEPRA